MKITNYLLGRLYVSGPAFFVPLLLVFFSTFLSAQDVTRPTFSNCLAVAAPLTATSNNCGIALPDYRTQLTATDNVTPTASLILSQTPAPGVSVTAGVETIVVTARDEAGNVGQCSFSVTIQPNVNSLACISQVNITLDVDCGATLVPSMLVSGGGACVDALDFDIQVTDNNPSNGAEVDGCGRFRYTITEVVTPGGPNIPNFTNCWGYVNAEDKISPVLVQLPTAPAILYCDDVATVNLNTLANNVSRCYRVDGQTGVPLTANFLTTALGQKLVAGGGLPLFFDGCSDLEICVNDVVANNGGCQNTIITRIFTARDGDCVPLSGVPNAPRVVSYPITFTRPTLAQVIGIPPTAEFSCSDFTVNQPNPQPESDDFPFFNGPDGPVYLSSAFCNLGASFSDGPRIVTCANTYKFVRTYTVIDWCEVGTVRTFNQIVKVGDFIAPTITAPTQDLNFDGVADTGPLFFSTNSTDCNSFFVIPQPGVTDNCVGPITVSAVIYPNGVLTAAPLGPFVPGGISGAIPRGTHLLRYTATDGCANVSTTQVSIRIDDRTAPIAICEDGLNISLGGNGTALLLADMIDRASYDDCSAVTLAIARLTGDNAAIGNYLPSLSLTCDNIGTLRVGLRVTDAMSNVNYCWLNVLIEDKAAPICVAPAPRTVTCADLDGAFPDNLGTSGLTEEATIALLNTRFGVPNGVDNCSTTTITQSYSDNRTSCGTGTIARRFLVRDAVGLTSAPSLNSPQNLCRQTITILGVHDYTIVFPGDSENSDCILPSYNGLTFTTNGCDLITVATHIDTFLATSNECYKLRIEYEVLNWCEYGTFAAPYLVPRDADNDNVLNEITVLHVLPQTTATLTDDIAVLDRDVIRTNTNTIGRLDIGDGGVVAGADAFGYGRDRSRGAFIYRQFIKVYDQTAPVIVAVSPAAPGLDNDGDCQADIVLNFNAQDVCSPAGVTITALLDQFVNPGADNVYTLSDFVSDGGNVTNRVTRLTGGNFRINLTGLPLGSHAVRIAAMDGCGNTALRLITFEIIDNKAPTPICINGLTVTLMPNGQGGGMADIWVSDFIASPSTDCSGPVRYAIYTSAQASVAGFTPNPANTSLNFSCADVGMQAVRIYAIDQSGRADYCETSLFVQVHQTTICGGSRSGSLAGAIRTPANQAMNGVTVNLVGGNTAGNTMTEADQTDAAGNFLFTDLPLGDDYTLQPVHNPNINLARVSTGDLILISRHILGQAELAGTYQLLAADVNNDTRINVQDIIAIRRVILGLTNTYGQQRSWRFFDAITNAEVINENNLNGNVTNARFVAVEMGNVSDAVVTGSGFQSGDGSPRSTSNLEVNEVSFEVGQEFVLNFTSHDLAGFQGTLQLNSGLELVELAHGQTNAGNFNLEQVATGLIGMSYYGNEGELFSLRVRATEAGASSDYVSISNRLVIAEGYVAATGEVTSLGLDFLTTGATASTTNFAVAQNFPNPFVTTTQINFELPVATQTTLVVQNHLGQVVMARTLDGVQGKNSFVISRDELKGASGLFTYTIKAGTYQASRKMIVG